MAMSLDDIRNFVRGFPDIDSSDLPNAVLDPLIRDAYYRFAAAERTWDFYETSYTLVTVPLTQTYSTATIGTYPLSSISDIKGPNFMLAPAPHQMAQTKYQYRNLTGVYPRVWSIWANTLYLWPTPSSAQTHQVFGYREPIDFVAQGAGASPDLPSEMHMLIAKWALQLAYLQQDSFFIAEDLKAQVEETYQAIRRKHIGGDAAGAIIVGGGLASIAPNSVFADPRFIWEK